MSQKCGNKNKILNISNTLTSLAINCVNGMRKYFVLIIKLYMKYIFQNPLVIKH